MRRYGKASAILYIDERVNEWICPCGQVPVVEIQFYPRYSKIFLPLMGCQIKWDHNSHFEDIACLLEIEKKNVDSKHMQNSDLDVPNTLFLLLVICFPTLWEK